MNLPSGRRPVVAVAAVIAALVCAGLPAAAEPGPTAPPGQSDRAVASAPDAATAAAVEQAPVRPGELLVKAAPGSQQAAARAVEAVGARPLRARRGGWQVAAVAPGRERVTARRLAADPAVALAEPNYLRFADSHVTDEVTWGVRSVGAPDVWEATPPITGAGARVAVVDSGVDARHPQLVGRVAPGYDVYGTGGRDDCGHGTAVAGVMGAAHDGSGPVGVAPDATIVPVKVLRHEDFFGGCVGDDEAIARGIMWAADRAGGRADIINLSLSGPPPSQVLADAVAYATRQGALVVAASGNAGDRVPNYPAAYPDVISVGGLQQGTLGPQWWPLSTFGSVDIAAPAHAVPIILAGGVTANRVGARSCPPVQRQPLCADGTSFAVPHVTGLAALLHQHHPELATLPAGDRVSRLRQWVLGTAVDIAAIPSQRGVDLHTGHGRPDAVAAVAAGDDADRMLVTWEAGERVLSPSWRMPTPASLSASLVVSTGTGEPLANREVVFRPPSGGTVSRPAALTDAAGRATTVMSSTAAGQRTSLSATVGSRTLRLESYVLQLDDNIPGVRLPAAPFRDRLDVVYDVDDVYRVSLKAGERLRANLTGIDTTHEYVDLYLHNTSERDVTDPDHTPLHEDTLAFERDPQRLRRTVQVDGVRYLHVLGVGTYRMKWWIRSPGKVRRAAASPSTITPDGDGQADTTRITWRNSRPGEVTLRIRNSDGRVVRRVAFGPMAKGNRAYRWDGTNNRGRVARQGLYRATLHWDNGRGRVSSTSTRVRLSR